jgi:hypothetical protein
VSAHVVGFDGTPVHGGAGARVAIVAVDGDEVLHVTDGRTLARQRFDELVEGGFVTRVDGELPAPVLDGRAVYRDLDAGRAGVAEELLGVRWVRQREVEVAYLSRARAGAVLYAHADGKRFAALSALADRRPSDAVRLAREGLMAVPQARGSELAAALYAVLLAVAIYDADVLKRVRREIGMMLDESLREVATLRSYLLVARRAPHVAVSSDIRDVAVARGTPKPPRASAVVPLEMEL